MTPGPSAGPSTGSGGRWRWVVAAVVVVAVAGAVVAGLRPTGTDEPAGPTSTGTTPPAAPTTEERSDREDSDEGGLLASILGDDPQRLVECLTPTDRSTSDLPDDPAAAVDVIGEQVAEERDLSFTEPVDPQLLPPSRLQERVEAMSREDYDEVSADTDARLLAALGVLEPDVDLQQLTLELLGEQVAGFYDPETGELTAIAREGLDPVARITLAHELDHALVDQAIGLPDLDGPAGRGDAQAAALAVVEGDATLLMQRWAAAHLGLVDQLSMATGAVGPTTSLEQAPWLLQQQLVFPYTAGLTFACEQFADGGWSAVDALYADLPTTTAQVLWPERYERGEVAVDVAAPRLPPGDWEPLRTEQVGATDLLWLFQAPGDDRGAALDEAERRARAWAGGRLLVAGRGEQTAVGMVLAEHREAELSLCDAVRTWYDRSFEDDTVREDRDATVWSGPDQSASLSCSDDRVRLGIGPDVATADAVVE